MIDEQLILNEIKLLRALVEERLPPKKKQQHSVNKGKKKYGEHGKVRLTEEEYNELDKQWGDAFKHGLKVFDDYLDRTPRRYNNHYKMFTHHWVKDRMLEWQQQNQQKTDKRSLWQ